MRSFLSEAASYANVLTIVSFSLERYLAICRPLYVFPLSDLRRAVIVSSLCWTVAMLASIPHLLFTKWADKCGLLHPFLNSGSTSSPSPTLTDPQHLSLPFVPCSTYQRFFFPRWTFLTCLMFQWYPVHEISFIVFFLLPVLLLAFLYVSMVVVVKTATKASIR